MTPTLTILAVPKAFQGHISVIQRNAIASWTNLKPRPDIRLYGTEDGMAEAAAELGVRHETEIARNEFGTPMLDDLLARARGFAQTPLLCYVNSDIILLQEFLDAMTGVQKKFPQFLGVAHRLNIDLEEPIDFAHNGEEKLRREILPKGTPGNPTAIDLFVFPPNTYTNVPPLILGRAWFDQWLIKDARARKIPVVDITRVARAIHQNHEYLHIAGGQQGAYWGEEARRNLAIYGGVPHTHTLLNVSHELLEDGSIRTVHFRRERAAVKRFFWKTVVNPTVGIRRKLGLSRSTIEKDRTANA
ncbi:MAG TPA: hypothetical protein VN025_19280 [Candidatus Dormibacteraeota bacterium]|jgi:hypothetical protein|nr:hypothetical protein [Candidatus Dormibacteraeota bacterium]